MNRSNATAAKRSEVTRARIFEAALSLFRKHGFDRTTMRDIAKEAGVALGAAYYYFDSKDALVMDFYERAQVELRPLLTDVLSKTKGLEERLRALLDAKLQYFAPNRSLLGTLSAHIDPQHPLSPFSAETQAIRDADISVISQALEGSKVRIPVNLETHLPRLLWLYQMGLLLFWVYDRSPKQARTTLLLDKSLGIVVTLIKFSSLPLLRPVRKIVTDLLEVLYGTADSVPLQVPS